MNYINKISHKIKTNKDGAITIIYEDKFTIIPKYDDIREEFIVIDTSQTVTIDNTHVDKPLVKLELQDFLKTVECVASISKTKIKNQNFIFLSEKEQNTKTQNGNTI